jgi:hypothetical protein
MTCRSPVVRRSRAFSGMDFRTADVGRRCIVRGASEGVPTKNAVRLMTEPAGIGSIHRVRRRFVPVLRRSNGAACQLPSTALAAGHTVSSPHVPRTSLVLVADLLRLLRLMFQSRTRLAAANLFLRRQLACYIERQVRPHRMDKASRIALVLLSHCVDAAGLRVKLGLTVSPRTVRRYMPSRPRRRVQTCMVISRYYHAYHHSKAG